MKLIGGTQLSSNPLSWPEHGWDVGMSVSRGAVSGDGKLRFARSGSDPVLLEIKILDALELGSGDG